MSRFDSFRPWLRRAEPGRRATRPLSLERLEDRTVPTKFMVLNLNNAGAGSLRQAVLDANARAGADAVEFAPAARGMIVLATQINITDDLTITGPGAAALSVSGNNTTRVLSVAPSASVTLAGLTVTAGRAQEGAGIYNSGDLTLRNATLSNNYAWSIGRGGGVYSSAAATLTVEDSTFSTNTALGDAPPETRLGGGKGGAIYNEGAATIVRGTFTGNRAMGAGGSAVQTSKTGVGGRGGAVWHGLVDGPTDAVMTVIGSTFTSNQAVGGNAGPDLFGGAAVGGGIYNRDAVLVVVDSTFTTNQAVAGNGGTGRTGGNGVSAGIHNTGYVLVMGSMFTGNLSSGGNGGPAAIGTAGVAGGGGFAGGMGTASDENIRASMTILGTAFRQNRAIGGLGGNGAPGGAGVGGAFVADGTVDLYVGDSTVADNLAVGGTGGNGGAGGGVSGGVMRLFSDSAGVATAVFERTTFTGNRGIGGQGGIGGAGGIATAGAIFAAGQANIPVYMAITNCTFSGNQAVGGAGGITGNGGIARGGALHAGLNSEVLVTSTTFTGNEARGGSGGFAGNGGDGRGGGVSVGAAPNAGTAVLIGTEITNNRATGGAAGDGGVVGRGQGGGLYIDTGWVFVRKTRIQGNHASTSNNDVFGDPIDF